MSQELRAVKFRSLKMAWLFALMGCTSLAPTYQIKTESLYNETMETHPNYLVMSLQYPPAAKLRQELESQDRLKLQNRGEAHITVISPPEFDVLKKNLSIDEINQIAQKNNLQKADLKVVCLGKGQKDKSLATYFLVVKSQQLIKIRSEIEKAWRSKGGSGDFKAEHFYPHITLGFTERDLHESDGVIKDEHSCISEVSTL